MLYRVSLLMLCKIFRSLWAWMLKVSTAACAVTQHKYSISSSPAMTSTRGGAHIVICLSGIRHYTGNFKKTAHRSFGKSTGGGGGGGGGVF